MELVTPPCPCVRVPVSLIVAVSAFDLHSIDAKLERRHGCSPVPALPEGCAWTASMRQLPRRPRTAPWCMALVEAWYAMSKGQSCLLRPSLLRTMRWCEESYTIDGRIREGRAPSAANQVILRENKNQAIAPAATIHLRTKCEANAR